MSRLHILIHCWTIAYLNRWLDDPSRLSATIAYLNTCGPSTPRLISSDFYYSCWFFSVPFPNCFAQRPKVTKFIKLFRNFSRFKMLIWTQRMQFWKTCLNFPYQLSPSKIGQDPEETQTWFFQILLSYKLFLWAHRM